MRRVLRVLVLASILVACSDSSDRPSVSEMQRRATILGPVLLGHPPADISDEAISKMTCILDDDHDEIGYRLGMRDNPVEIQVAAALAACPEHRWNELSGVIADVMGVPVSDVHDLVSKGRAALASP